MAWQGGTYYQDPNVNPGYNPNAGGYPQGGYPPPGGYPQGGYPPPGGYPQGGYPPPGGYPQGGYPPAGGYPQGGYPPPPAQAPYGFVDGGNAAGYGGAGAGFADPEDGSVKGFEFTEQSVRRAFIRKVYSILMTQLLVTCGVIALFVYHKPTQAYVRNSPALFFVALAVLIVTMISLACCTSVRRNSPMNIIFLGLFTLAESFFLGVSSTRYAEDTVLIAVGVTAAICLALTIFAFQTKWDFTVMGGILFVGVIILLLFGLLVAFVGGSKARLAYSCLGALLFSVYLIYDTQLMMGGKHKYSISPEEYIFAALNLYLDVVNIFIYILSIIGAARD